MIIYFGFSNNEFFIGENDEIKRYVREELKLYHTAKKRMHIRKEIFITHGMLKMIK